MHRTLFSKYITVYIRKLTPMKGHKDFLRGRIPMRQRNVGDWQSELQTGRQHILRGWQWTDNGQSVHCATYTLHMLHLISKFSRTGSFLRVIFLSKETMVYPYSLPESLLLDNNFTRFGVLEAESNSYQLVTVGQFRISWLLRSPEIRAKSQSSDR